MSQHQMTNNQNERNRMLRYMSTSATPISRRENNQRGYDQNLHPRQEIVHDNLVPTNVYHNVGSFSHESIPPLRINPRSPTSSAQGFSTRLIGSNILPNQRRILDPNGPHQYQTGNTTSSGGTRYLPIKRRSSENSSSREYEVGESSTRQRVHRFENNPNNNLMSMSSTPFGHVNSSTNFNLGHEISQNNFQSYEQGSSSSQFGMGSWAPRDHSIFGNYQSPNMNSVYSILHLNAPSSLYIHNTINIHQYVMTSPTSDFVTPSPPNVQASSSSFDPLPSYAQQNQLLPMLGSRTSEQNQLLFATARVGENLERILMSISPQLRTERNRLRDQIHMVQQLQLNSGFVAADDVIITRYSRALDILDAQERLDQLNSGARRYVMEMGLREEEIMEYIRHEFFQSRPDETCAICQEDYLDGEHIGVLDCGHRYHLGCIKQWLLRKNMCPVCKQRALNVED